MTTQNFKRKKELKTPPIAVLIPPATWAPLTSLQRLLTLSMYVTFRVK